MAINHFATRRTESAAMRKIAVINLCQLAGCGTIETYFRDAPATVTRIVVGEVLFDVRVRRKLAEAIRVESNYPPRGAHYFNPAQAAIEVDSGCKVDRIGGDQAQITGILDCPSVRNAPPLITDYTCRP